MSDDKSLSKSDIDRLMARFVGLSVDEGRKLYSTLTPAQQAVLDARRLKSHWRSMRAREAHERRQKAATDEFKQAVAEGKRLGLKGNKAFQRSLKEAEERKRRS
jgi:hypothetical protein